MGLFSRRKKKEMESVKNDILSDIEGMSKEDKVKKLRDDIELEILKLPKKMRARARKLYGMYTKGQVLRPDQDIDNKKLIMEKE